MSTVPCPVSRTVPNRPRRLCGTVICSIVLVALPVLPQLYSPAGATVAAAVDVLTDGALSRPDTTSAMLAAQQLDHPVEDLSQADEFTHVYANPDGSWTANSTPEPQQVQTPDGAWHNIDTTLQERNGSLVPNYAASDLSLSDGGDNTFAEMTEDGHTLDWRWPHNLPRPVVDGDTATYRDVLPHGDLVVTATPTGFSHSIVFSAAPADDGAITLPVATHGASLDETRVGGVDITSQSGQVIAAAPQPLMWDSSSNSAGDPQVADVSVDTGVTANGTPSLTLTPDASFLADPGTVYPVTVDPDFTTNTSGDTWIQNPDYTTSQGSTGELRVGTQDGGTHKARTFLRFNNTDKWTGKNILSATLVLRNFNSASCTNAPIRASRITDPWTVTNLTWANQPSVSSGDYAEYSKAQGFDSSCPSGDTAFNVQQMVQNWASGTANYGIRLAASNETNSSTWRKYRSSNYSDQSLQPHINVTYASNPNSPSQATFSPRVIGTTTDQITSSPSIFATSSTPTFSARVGDPDGSPVSLEVRVIHDGNFPNEGTGQVADLTSNRVPSGSIASVTLTPGQLSGAHFMYQMRETKIFAGTTYASPWTPATLPASSASKFAVWRNTPAAPTISCPDYSRDVWSPNGGSTTSCTFSTASTYGSGYYWGLDDTTAPNLVPDNSNSGASLTVSIPITAGSHTLTVRTRDWARQVSPSTAYTFGVGPGAVTSPAVNTTTQKAVALSALGAASNTGVTFQWAPGASSTSWSDIPVGDVTPAGSSASISAWPLPGGTSGGMSSFSGYNWNVASTLSAAGQTDGPLQIRAKFMASDGSINFSAPQTFQLVATQFSASAATAPIGPGNVSLTTGDFESNATDVSLPGLSVSRTITTLNPAAASTGAAGVFGPGWLTDLPGPMSGEGDAVLLDNATSGGATIRENDGTELAYARQSASQGTVTYTGVGDAADGSRLTYSSSLSNPVDPSDTTTYTGWQLLDADGTTTTWLRDQSGTWSTRWVTQPGSHNGTSFSRDANGRVTSIIAPVPNGVTCSASSAPNTPGCTTLRFAFATATTATGSNQGSWGDYLGQVSGVTWTGYDPAVSSMVTKQVAAYQYDSTGHLRAEWDPRLSSNPLVTTYSYDSNGRLASINPPGESPWTMSYDTSGRLANITRIDPVNGAAVQSVVYGIPVSATGLPDVSGSASASWGQATDVSYQGAAVFPASHVPVRDAGTGTYTPTTSDWAFAKLTYADVAGHVTNTAQYGAGAWRIDSTQYDSYGNSIWSLGAGNRDQALTPTSATDPYVASQSTSSTRANLLATVTTYSSDGADELTVFGPTHPATLSDGTVASVRQETAYTYDAGAPTADAYHLETKAVTSSVPVDGSSVPDSDTRTEVTGYDPIDGSSATGPTSGWTLRQPTTQTVLMGSTPSSADLVTQTRYDQDGRVVESRLPGGGASDPTTTVSTYYTAAANNQYPGCGGRPYFADLLCRKDPGGPVPGGNPAPSQLFAYDLYDNATTTTEIAGSATRTTTRQFDTVGRVTSLNTTTSGLTGSKPLATSSTAYDPSTGLVTSQVQGANSLTSTYDTWGRRTTYTDADAVKSTWTYNIDGQVSSIADGLGTTTFTYGAADDHRQLPAGESSGMGSAPSSFAASYDADGQMAMETYPNGMTAQRTFDNTGAPVDLTYTLPTYSAATASVLDFRSSYNAFGEVSSAQSPMSNTTYSYDRADRLSSVGDFVGGQCISRAYSYDQRSDRTSSVTYPSSTDGSCQTGSGSTAAETFDSFGRLKNSGYSYDLLGRDLAIPQADLSNGTGSMSLSYYDSDALAGTQLGTQTKNFSIDPDRRDRLVVDATSGTETRRIINHYADDSDSPAWTSTSTDGGVTSTSIRNVLGLDGSLAALQPSVGNPALQVVNLHGDVVATLPDQIPSAGDPTGASITSYAETTEFGVPRSSGTPPRYGWLGGARRSSDAQGGLVLMGARPLNPLTNQFTSMDAVWGGNANWYTYPTDPVNRFDLSGNCSWCDKFKHLLDKGSSLTHLATGAIMGYIGGYINSITSGISAIQSAMRQFIVQTMKSNWRDVGKFLNMVKDAFKGTGSEDAKHRKYIWWVEDEEME